MDIEQFYDQDERRRESAESEFGTEWTDRVGNTYELSWIADTGELYLMSTPAAFVTEDFFLGATWSVDEPMSSLAVHVIATIPDEAAVTTALAGWEEAERGDYSLRWLMERFPDAATSAE